MAILLSPYVYWAQSKKNLFIKIDLKDVKGPTIKLEKRTLEFESKGVGAQGPQNYGFSLTFYSEINTEESHCTIQDGKVRFNIAKAKKCWWPRLTTKLQKPTWLKKDLDYWKSEEALTNKDQNIRDFSNHLPKDHFGYPKEQLKKIYLLIYNLFMFVGYMYVISILIVRYLQDGSDCFPGIYEAVGTAIKYLQVLQLSEVTLAASGITSGGFSTLLMEILGRLLIIYCLIDTEPRLQIQPVIFYLYVIWSAVEIIRYLFYITQICKVNIFYITWLRYTIWIFSIPLEMTAEAIAIYKSISYLEDTSKFTYSLPNAHNLSFSLSTFLQIVALFILTPVAYIMMSHMYQARINKLGSKAGMETKME